MRPDLTSKASRQGGLFTRSQALAAGYTEREMKSLTRPGGSLRVVRHGIYAEAALVESLDNTQRWLLMDRAALMVSQRPAIASHDSAARILGIPTLAVDEPASHLTSVGKAGARRSGGITRHRDMLPLCVELRDGLEATSYARTAIDLGRLHGYRHGLVATDAVRQLGVPLRDLEAELDRMENHPFIARARAAVKSSATGAESVAETLGRELVEELGFGEVETQFAVGISDGRVVVVRHASRVPRHRSRRQGQTPQRGGRWLRRAPAGGYRLGGEGTPDHGVRRGPGDVATCLGRLLRGTTRTRQGPPPRRGVRDTSALRPNPSSTPARVRRPASSSHW